jgi:hypothetical protein
VYYGDDGSPTELYLVRIWRGKGREDGATDTHGKLQHVVSGASSYFDKLSDLPEALEKMMEQEAGSVNPSGQVDIEPSEPSDRNEPKGEGR